MCTRLPAKHRHAVTRCPTSALLTCTTRPCGYLPKVAKVNTARKTLIRKAWQDGDERKSLEFWTAYFEECEASNFLNGKGPYTNGHENWRPDFDYLMQGKTILRTYEKALTRMEQEQ
jgi:hypothetical protein